MYSRLKRFLLISGQSQVYLLINVFLERRFRRKKTKVKVTGHLKQLIKVTPCITLWTSLIKRAEKQKITLFETWITKTKFECMKKSYLQFFLRAIPDPKNEKKRKKQKKPESWGQVLKRINEKPFSSIQIVCNLMETSFLFF